ncbi:MAG: hypothetical protein ACYC8V_03010 [Caulobacteraceae bacterium]
MNRLKILLTAAFLSAVALPASAAVGDATFDAFQRVCGDTHADYPAVASVSNADGWKNSDVLASPMSGVTVSEKLARTKIVDGGELTLDATSGLTKSGFKVSTCRVHGAKAGFSVIKARAERWLGLAPHDSTAESTTFHFTGDGAKFKSVADNEADAAAAGDGMQILTIKLDGGRTVLDYVKIRK